MFYYVLVNQARGLYGRILTEVPSTDQGQGRPSSVNKMFIIWPNKKEALKTLLEASLSSRLVLSAILFTNGDEKFGQKKVELAHWQVCFHSDSSI